MDSDKKCSKCQKTLPLGLFETKVKDGKNKVMSQCMPCTAKTKAYAASEAGRLSQKRRKEKYRNSTKGKQTISVYASSDAAKESKKKYDAGRGKQTKAEYRKTDSYKESQARYFASAKGKATVAKNNQKQSHKDAVAAYNKSNGGKDARKKYWMSSKGKECRKRYEASGAYASKKKRQRVSYVQRYASDPNFKLKRQLISKASNLVSGRLKESPTFVDATSFASEDDFVKHVVSTIPQGLSLNDYGVLWEIDHKIPQEAYDFSNPSDVKRCWSSANVRGLPPSKNQEKSWTIVDDLCMQVGPSYYPSKWAGCIPTEEEKQSFYNDCLRSATAECESDPDVSNEDSD